MHISYFLKAFFSLHLFITSSYGFILASEPGAQSSVIDRRNVSAPKTFKGFDNGVNASSQINPVEDPMATLEPEWPVVCSAPSRRFARPLDEQSCLHLATVIETSPGATSFRIYSGQQRLSWIHGNCHIFMRGLGTGTTDVFKPVLIARNIRRILHICASERLGGATNVGPRKRFVLVVSSSLLDPTETVAIS